MNIILVSFAGLVEGVSDYTPIDMRVRFRGGRVQETLLSLDVDITDDEVEEPTEEFFINVVAEQNIIVLTPLLTVRIIGIGRFFDISCMYCNRI